MANDNQEVDFDCYIARYQRHFTGNPEMDAYFRHTAEHLHALNVCDAIIDSFTSIVRLSQSVTSIEAKTQLRFGAAPRTKFIWLSLRNLIRLAPPERIEPLLLDDVDEVARDLNVIYINIRGTLDNLAWALIDLFGDERTKRLPAMSVHLFGKELLADANFTEVAKFVSDFAGWNSELKTRRDPAAHRIPLTVPPSVLDKAAQAEYERIAGEYNKALNAAVRILSEGGNGESMFEKSRQTYEKLQRVGIFAPVFVHHPGEKPTKIYPVVPQDVGQLVKITNRTLQFISDKHPR